MTVAVLFVVFAVHTVFAVYLFRSLTASKSDRGNDESPPGEEGGFGTSEPLKESRNTTDFDPDISAESVVECPVCGVPNATDFQFCRHCVSDLSAGNTQNFGTGPTS